MSHASQQAELHRMMSAASFQNTPLRAEYGELATYDPTLHQGQFLLPMVLDENDQASMTSWLPIGTVFAGINYGMQFPPPDLGMQALIVFVDHQGFSPVAAILMYNTVDIPPFPDGKSMGWKDKQGNSVTTTLDGENSGDGAGGGRLVGASYASVTAPKVALGADALDFAEQGVVRLSDDQSTTDKIIAAVQAAISTLCTRIQSGGGVAPPTVAAVTAEASTTVAAND